MIADLTGRREATASPSAPSRSGASLWVSGLGPVSPWQGRDVAGAGVKVGNPLQPDLDRPHAVVDFFKADIVAGERASEKDDVLRPQDAAVRADAPHLEMAGVVEGRDAARQRSIRGGVVRRGWGLTERLVRPLVVVFVTKAAKAALLRARGASRRTGRLRLEHGVELLMGPVLFGMPGQNALEPNAELQPPHREPGQAAQARAGE